MTSRSLLLALTLAAPALARAGLLETPLAAPALDPPDLSVRPMALLLARAGDPKPAGEKQAGGAQPAPPAAGPGDLDFDLLGEAKAPQETPDAEAMKQRRKLLTLHQGVGMGLYALTLGTVVVGQLNYRDKFATDANTGKWRIPHAALAYTTAAVFALNAGLALAAPEPVKRPGWQWDRVTVHRIAMFTAAVGMAAQIGLGIYTSSREGYVNQQDLAKAHLYIGYGTLVAMTTGVGVLVF